MPHESNIEQDHQFARFHGNQALIDRAADEMHESRSSFMLEASLARAESVLADRTRSR